MKLFTILLVLGLLSVALGQSPPAGTIWIDRFNSEVGRTPALQIAVNCGPNGDDCNNNRTIETTLVQPEGSLSFAPGTAPIGGERFSYLSIFNVQKQYGAGPKDEIRVTYDINGEIGVHSSPGIGGSYLLLWNGVGHNDIPCHTTITNPCALDESCCNTGNPALLADFSADLTGGGTQFGIGLYQDTSDFDTPVIMRLWGSDGRSIVLRKGLEAAFVGRNILFLYKDFVAFPGDSNPVKPSEIMDFLKTTKAIALQVYGHLALDARLSYIRTAGVIVSKTIPVSYQNITLVFGQQICYDVFIGNNAPKSVNALGTEPNNVLDLTGVNFLDTMFTDEMMLVPGSITVNSPIAYKIDNTGNVDVVSVTFTEDLKPEDNASIHFCAQLRPDYAAPFCRNTFCNVGTVTVPGFNNIQVGAGSAGCVNIKFETSLGLAIECPDLLQVSNPGTPKITLHYENRGPAPATNTMLTLWIKGINPIGLSSSLNTQWTCNPDLNSPLDTLKCTQSLGQLTGHIFGSSDFFLNLPVNIPCNITSLFLNATITETCSNSYNSSQCTIPIPHKVLFDIKKDAGLAADQVAVPNQLITYTISYRNLGNTDAEMVQLIEQYPLYTTPVGNPLWTCDNTTRTCTLDVGTVPVNTAIITVQFSVRLDSFIPQSVSTLCNTVTITNTMCNISDVCKDTKQFVKCIPVAPGLPDTGVEKEGYIARLIYRLTYYNNGSADATNVVITESIPAGSKFDSNRSDSRWVCVGSTCTITIPLLKEGESGTALFVVNLNQDFQQPQTCWNNTATINLGDTSATEPSPLDNIATFNIGACGQQCEVQCPNPCVECPNLVCHDGKCNCPTTVDCTCPDPICPTCPKNNCVCDKICNCPIQPTCHCGNLDCACPAKCEKITEECGCKEIININLPCDLCPNYSPSASYAPTPHPTPDR